jgi:hypothetical protein
MPRSLIPTARDGRDSVRRPAWALAALLAALVTIPPVAAQNGGEKPRLYFYQDAKGQLNPVRELRLRPNVPTKAFLFVRNDGAPADKLKVALFAGDEPVPGASKEVNAVKGLTPVIFGKAPPPKDGKDGKDGKDKEKPPPLTAVEGALSVRLLDAKGQEIDKILIGVAAPREYVAVDSITFDPNESDGKKNILEITLSARKNFTGDPARVELVLPPERIPDLLPDQKKFGSYGGLLAPGQPLVLRAENLKFREDVQLKQGLFYLTIDGYPRAYSFVSSFAAEKTASQPREVTPPVLRLVHPKFAKPGDKVKVIVEVDNMPGEAYGTLAMFREFKEGKELAGAEGPPRRFDGDRAQVLLFNAAGPAGALQFDSKVVDHTFVFDTKDIFGVRWLAARMIDKAQEAAKAPDPLLTVLDSKKIPESGLTGGTKLVVEPLLLYEGKPDLILDVDLPPPPKGAKLPLLAVGAPLPLKALTKDPTGVVKTEFFLGKPLPDGKLPPVVVEGEKVPGNPDLWVAQLPAPTEKALIMTVGVQATNGVGDKTIKLIKIQLVDPKAPGLVPVPKLATIAGTVVEGDRPQAGVPVVLFDDMGKIKGATATDKAGKYKLEKVLPGAYTVVATRSASKTRGQALVSVPPEVALVENVDIMLLRQGKQ